MILLLLLLIISVCNATFLGYSTWEAFHGSYTEKDLIDNVILLKNFKNYKYFNIDGGWWEGYGSGQVKRDHNTGAIKESSKIFPKGMNHFSDFVHNNGLLFGLYTSSARRACVGDKGMSLNNEKEDADQFLKWNIDFLKIDNCGLDKSQIPQVVKKWSSLFKDTNVTLGNCRMGCYERLPYYKWCPRYEKYVTYRTSKDIKPNWKSIIHNFETLFRNYNIEGSIPDPDFLEVGNVPFIEGRSQFALWSITSSPLIISTDLRKLSIQNKDLLLNEIILEINENRTKLTSIINKKFIKVTKRVFVKSVEYLAILFVNIGSKTISHDIKNDNCIDIFKNYDTLLKSHDSIFLLCPI